MYTELACNMDYLSDKLEVNKNFDLVYRVIHIGGKEACFYFIDGFCKDDIMEKLLEFFTSIESDAMPKEVHSMMKQYMPYVEVDLKETWEDILYGILSGQLVLFIDGFEQCILIDSRTYPARAVSEPDKDKALRGSKDGFVETIIFNTALIRRRIRSTDLCMEMLKVGESSQTDVVLCYMNERVDQVFLEKVKSRIENIQVDALSMNQESLAECLYQRKWYNPFPKFKFTERPDTAAAQVLEGNIIILVDNSPSAMITPVSLFDIAEEADDYYFPPITGSYLRLSRLLIAVFTYLLTPTFLLLMQRPEWIPQGFQFIMIKETQNIPLIWQFLMLELAIDGLRLAAVNTPSMLSTPLSIMAALVLGEFSINSGWFNAEVMLYMAFVALASYTQASFELSYALKFMRIITLVLTQLFGVIGYVSGILILIISLVSNKTISNKSYLYPLCPLNIEKLSRRLLRLQIHSTIEKK